MQVCPYETRDFDALYELDQSCFAPGVAYSKSTLRYFLALSSAQCLLAVEGTAIGGFILAEVNAPLAHIITLDVAEAYRRRGVASLLLSALENKLSAEGVSAIILETAVNNDAAIALWRQHGYRVQGVLKRYYLRRTDAFEMRKSLSALRK